MKQIIRGFVVVSLLSFAMTAIAQPTISQKMSSAKLQSLQTQSTSPTIKPEVEWKQLIDAIFSPKAVQIPFSAALEKGRSKQVFAFGNIYYSKGDLFVLNDQSSRGEEITNFATINGKLYAWEKGARRGKILKRVAKDTENLLIYLTDAAGIKRSLYFQSYREKPDDFIVTQQENIKTLEFKVVDHFVGIKIQENPLWLRSFIAYNCVAVTSTTELSVFEVNRPIPLEKIPDSVGILPPDIKFEPTNETVETYMVYL